MILSLSASTLKGFLCMISTLNPEPLTLNHICSVAPFFYVLTLSSALYSSASLLPLDGSLLRVGRLFVTSDFNVILIIFNKTLCCFISSSYLCNTFGEKSGLKKSIRYYFAFSQKRRKLIGNKTQRDNT